VDAAGAPRRREDVRRLLGQASAIIDPSTGERIVVELFLAVLGASSYTYAEATPTQRVADFVASHVRMFAYFVGVTEVVVRDQLKSAVTVPSARTATSVVTTAQSFVRARPKKPRDKAEVEVALQVAQR
jgi:transposase